MVADDKAWALKTLGKMHSAKSDVLDLSNYGITKEKLHWLNHVVEDDYENQLPEIKTMNVSKNEGAMCWHLADLVNNLKAQELIVQNCSIKPEEMNGFALEVDSPIQIHYLDVLDLSENRNIISKHLCTILRRMKVKHLIMRHCGITKIQLNDFVEELSIAEKIPVMEILDVSENSHCAGKALSQVVETLKVSRLLMKRCNATKDELEQLSKMEFDHFDFRENDITVDMDWVIERTVENVRGEMKFGGRFGDKDEAVRQMIVEIGRKNKCLINNYTFGVTLVKSKNPLRLHKSIEDLSGVTIANFSNSSQEISLADDECSISIPADKTRRRCEIICASTPPVLHDWHFAEEYQPVTQMLTCRAKGLRFGHNTCPRIQMRSWCKSSEDYELKATLFHRENNNSKWCKEEDIPVSNNHFYISFEVNHFSNYFLGIIKKMLGYSQIKLSHMCFSPATDHSRVYEIRSIISKRDTETLKDIRDIQRRDGFVEQPSTGEHNFSVGKNPQNSIQFRVDSQENARIEGSCIHGLQKEDKKKLIDNNHDIKIIKVKSTNTDNNFSVVVCKRIERCRLIDEFYIEHGETAETPEEAISVGSHADEPVIEMETGSFGRTEVVNHPRQQSIGPSSATSILVNTPFTPTFDLGFIDQNEDEVEDCYDDEVFESSEEDEDSTD